MSHPGSTSLPCQGERGPLPRHGLLLTCAAALLAVLIASGLLQPMALASEDDHDDMHHALETGEIVPLDDILTSALLRFPGQVLRVELEPEVSRGHKHWVYEIKLLTDDGHVLKLEYDAATNALLSVKGRPGDTDD